MYNTSNWVITNNVASLTIYSQFREFWESKYAWWNLEIFSETTKIRNYKLHLLF